MTTWVSSRVLRHGHVRPGRVSVAGGSIIEDPSGPVDDLGDAIVMPGLVDIQINGAFGHDFTSDPQSMWEVARRLPAHGVTAFCPTIISAERGVVERALAVLADRPAAFVGAEPLGLHLEGPMIAPARRGAHPERAVARASGNGWSAPGVRIVTLAPEVVESGTIERLVRAGIVVAAGHSDADHDGAVAAFDAGVRHVTHLFNAMAPLHHRAPGLVGAALADDRVTVAMVADGIHVHPTTLLIVSRAVGPARLIATTDSTAAAGMPAGTYRLGEQAVQSDGRIAQLVDGTLAGSALTMNRSLVGLADAVGDLALSITAHASNPSRLLGETRRGSLDPGSRADVVAITDDGTVLRAMVGGVVVHEVGGTTALAR